MVPLISVKAVVISAVPSSAIHSSNNSNGEGSVAAHMLELLKLPPVYNREITLLSASNVTVVVPVVVGKLKVLKSKIKA